MVLRDNEQLNNQQLNNQQYDYLYNNDGSDNYYDYNNNFQTIESKWNTFIRENLQFIWIGAVAILSLVAISISVILNNNQNKVDNEKSQSEILDNKIVEVEVEDDIRFVVDKKNDNSSDDTESDVNDEEDAEADEDVEELIVEIDEQASALSGNNTTTSVSGTVNSSGSGSLSEVINNSATSNSSTTTSNTNSSNTTTGTSNANSSSTTTGTSNTNSSSITSTGTSNANSSSTTIGTSNTNNSNTTSASTDTTNNSGTTSDGTGTTDNSNTTSTNTSTSNDSSTTSERAELQSGKYYMLRNLATQKYMDVTDGVAANGTNVQQWGAYGPRAYNTWLIKYANSGYYNIYSQVGDGGTYLLDVLNGKAKSGTNIQILEYNATNSQWFKFKQNSDGTYIIYTKASGQKCCIEVDSGSKSSGANVRQATYTGADYQKWELILVE